MALDGLTSDEAARRRATAGPNSLPRGRRTPLILRIAAQFSSPVIYLPLAAAVVALVVGDRVDALAILAVLLLNATVGLRQERGAEKAVMALQEIAGARARVVRDGRSQFIDTVDVVPGDLLELEAGDRIPADAHLVESQTLTVNEATLTGESVPVSKTSAPEAEVHDVRIFMGTTIVGGTARAIVDRTGSSTELGQIAQMLESAEQSETPLQRRLAQLTRTLSLLCLAIVVLVSVLGLARGWSPADLFTAAVSLAIAAIPEGLPAIVTVALAIGVQRMAARHVLVRRLDAIETLGCTTVLCTDKTGTLTTGDMAVREVASGDDTVVLRAAAACCDASFEPATGQGVGDPAEVAILRAALSHGISRDDLERRHPRRRVTPFDAQARFMAVTRDDGVTYVKGAFDVLAARATHQLDTLRDAHARMTARALRVLAVGTAPTHDGPVSILGLIGIADPPRPEARRAIAEARNAGIKVLMITGDHGETAHAVARELGLLEENDVPSDVVHARARPGDKLDIVRRWKARGAVVTMIGDGVNDAPALKEADAGIAMHIGGTDVTREAADIVLTDNNFSSVIAAIREGRGIFGNIQKTIAYLMTGNLAELTVMAVAAAAGMPIPLLPLHLLWINLITDALPSLALVADPASADLMTRPPRDPRQEILGRGQWFAIIRAVALEAVVTLAVFVWALKAADLQTARGLAFSTLVYSEVFRALSARHPTLTFWRTGAGTNHRLVMVVVCSVALQTLIMLLPWTQTLFRVGAMSWQPMTAALAAGLIPVTAIELGKLRWRTRNLPHSA